MTNLQLHTTPVTRQDDKADDLSRLAIHYRAGAPQRTGKLPQWHVASPKDTEPCVQVHIDLRRSEEEARLVP